MRAHTHAKGTSTETQKSLGEYHVYIALGILCVQMSPFEGIHIHLSMDGEDQFDPTVIIAHSEFSV